MAEEEYFDDIAKRSASHHFNAQNCTDEKQCAYEDDDIDSSDTCYDGMSLNIIIMFAPPLLWVIFTTKYDN